MNDNINIMMMITINENIIKIVLISRSQCYYVALVCPSLSLCGYDFLHLNDDGGSR